MQHKVRGNLLERCRLLLVATHAVVAHRGHLVVDEEVLGGGLVQGADLEGRDRLIHAHAIAALLHHWWDGRGGGGHDS